MDGKTKSIVRSALFLTLAGFISKVLSAIYRVPLQNLTGDLGFYIYQQIYPIIGIVIVLGLYGYPAAISKVIAERKNDGLENNISRVYLPILSILFGMNCIIAIGIYTMAPAIAWSIGDPRLTSTFQMASLLFIALPFIAMLRGMSQGQDDMLPTAYSQVVEQVVRVAIIVACSYLVFVNRLELYQIGHAAVAASLTGMVIAIICLVFLFNKKSSLNSKRYKKTNIPWGYYIKTCLSIGIVAAMTHMILLLMQLIDVFTIVPGLIKGDLSPTLAMEEKGVFDRGQPLIQFGVVFGSSFALALVPAAVKKGAKHLAEIQEAICFSFYIAAAASLGLILLMPEVNQLLFLNTDGTMSLQILVIAIPLTAMVITAASILQTIGSVHIIAMYIVFAVAVKAVLNLFLVPLLGIIGSSIATVIGLSMLMLAILQMLHKKLPAIKISKNVRWVPFIFSSGLMSIFICMTKYLLPAADMSRLALLFYIIFTVLIGASIYLFILLRFNVFTDNQLQALPFADRILMFSKWISKRKEGKNDNRN